MSYLNWSMFSEESSGINLIVRNHGLSPTNWNSLSRISEKYEAVLLRSKSIDRDHTNCFLGNRHVRTSHSSCLDPLHGLILALVIRRLSNHAPVMLKVSEYPDHTQLEIIVINVYTWITSCRR